MINQIIRKAKKQKISSICFIYFLALNILPAMNINKIYSDRFISSFGIIITGILLLYCCRLVFKPIKISGTVFKLLVYGILLQIILAAYYLSKFGTVDAGLVGQTLPIVNILVFLLLGYTASCMTEPLLIDAKETLKKYEIK